MLAGPRRHFRDGLLAAAGLTALLGPAAPVRAEVEHATLAVPATVVLFLFEYVAEEEHIYDQVQLEVKPQLIVGVGSINAVIAGSSDFSISSGGSLTRAASHGQPLLAIANMNDHNGQDLVIRKDIADAAHFDPKAPLAERAKILKGKTIGIDGVGSVVDSLVKVVAKEGGIDPASVTVSPMQPADTLAAFSRHAIDGFAGGPPWSQEVVADGSAVIVASGVAGEPKQFDPIGSSMILTRADFCKQHQSICVKMGHAMTLAADFIWQHPEESLAILKKRFANVPDPALKASYEAVRDMTPRPPVPNAKELANAENMNVAAGFMKAEDKLKSYDNLFTTEFAK